MPTFFVIRSGPISWSGYKLREQKRDILRYLAQQGAPNCTWEEKHVGPDKKPEKIALTMDVSRER